MAFAIFKQGTPEEMTVKVVRRGRLRSRVVLQNGERVLVPSDLLSAGLGQDGPGQDGPGQDDPAEMPPTGRVVPLTPLRRLYRELRAVQGDRQQKFFAIRDRLEGRRGPQGDLFVVELFTRSRQQMEVYDNAGERFYGVRPPREEDAIHFANQLVELLVLNGADVLELDGINPFGYLDYEINPLRTRNSCWENGKAATNSGAGGMDLLLVSKTSPPQPVVAEIKARTETVGATFALIQTLTYAAELLTKSQMLRLQNHFPELDGVNSETPQLGLLVVLEGPITEPVDLNDLRYAIALARKLLEHDEMNSSISSIEFAEGRLNGENAELRKLSGDQP